jgi:proline iminopeptidase
MKKTMYIIPLLICITGWLGCKKELSIKEEGNLVPKTVENDKTLPSISVNGTSLHAESVGDADSAMVVVLHGGPGSDYRYLLNCKEFADHSYHVVFYDQRGSGLSKRHGRSSYGIQLMLDDLSAVIAHYEISCTKSFCWVIPGAYAVPLCRQISCAINGSYWQTGALSGKISKDMSLEQKAKITSEMIVITCIRTSLSPAETNRRFGLQVWVINFFRS